jgi:hypothetical protein
MTPDPRLRALVARSRSRAEMAAFGGGRPAPYPVARPVVSLQPHRRLEALGAHRECPNAYSVSAPV